MESSPAPLHAKQRHKLTKRQIATIAACSFAAVLLLASLWAFQRGSGRRAAAERIDQHLSGLTGTSSEQLAQDLASNLELTEGVDSAAMDKALWEAIASAYADVLRRAAGQHEPRLVDSIFGETHDGSKQLVQTYELQDSTNAYKYSITSEYRDGSWQISRIIAADKPLQQKKS